MYLEFNSTLFRRPADVAKAIAERWLTADGSNSEETIREFLSEYSDKEFAEEALAGWGLEEVVNEDAVRWDESGGTQPQTWLESRGISREDVEKAFSELRTEYAV